MNPHPGDFSCTACSLAGAGLGDGGFSRFGGFERFTYSESGLGYLIAFSVLNLDRPLADLAVFFFLDGAYLARVPAAVGYFDFLPPPAQDECDLVAYVFPNSAEFEDFPIPSPPTPNRLGLDWTYTGEISSVRVLIQAGATVTTTTPAEIFDAPIPTVAAPQAASGGTLEVSGVFLGAEKSGQIDLSVVSPGTPGDGVELAYVFGTHTGSLFPPDSRAHLLDGVFVTLESGHAFEVGDEWTITLDFPREYRSAPLPPGTHAARADTYNRRGAKTSSNTTNTTLDGPPAPPTLTTTAYNGAGEAVLTYLLPVDGAVETAVFYLNFHPLAVAEFPAPATGDPVAFTLPGLRTDYQNYVLCRLKSAAGLESQNLDWILVAIDAADALAAAAPNPPYDLRAVEIAGSLVSVSVDLDNSSDEVDIFVDAQDLAVDYSTPVATLTNPATELFQTVTASIDWTTLGAGTWRLAARALKSGYSEENTDVLADLVVELAAAPAATLTAEAVR